MPSAAISEASAVRAFLLGGSPRSGAIVIASNVGVSTALRTWYERDNGSSRINRLCSASQTYTNSQNIIQSVFRGGCVVDVDPQR